MAEKASTFLWLTIAAFLVLLTELLIFPMHMNFDAIIIHWGFMCAIWGFGAWFLWRISKERGYDILEEWPKAPLTNWIIVFVLLGFMIVTSYISWGGFKPIVSLGAMHRIFGNNGTLAFIAQQIYYLFEVAIFVTIIAFGQKFGETAFKEKRVPWGGIVCALTWGLVHIYTQDLLVGLVAVVWGLVFGTTYLLLKKNMRHAYPMIFLMFVL